MGIQAFTPQGNSAAFLAATSAPTPVQVPSAPGTSLQYEFMNPGSVTVFVGAGSNATNATANAVVVAAAGNTSPTLVILPGTDKVYTLAPNLYFTGITASGTATIYITPGDGL